MRIAFFGTGGIGGYFGGWPRPGKTWCSLLAPGISVIGLWILSSDSGSG